MKDLDEKIKTQLLYTFKSNLYIFFTRSTRSAPGLQVVYLTFT